MISLAFLVVSLGTVLSFPTQPPGSEKLPRCAQPAVSGMCLAYFPSYFYNPSSGKCESFVYGGCQGNENRFFSEHECMEVCGGFKIETQDFELQTDAVRIFVDSSESDSSEGSQPSEEQVEPESETPQPVEPEADPCKMPSTSGPCYAFMPRFFFNGTECVEFIYGGCQGNANNFFTLEACHQRCKAGVTPGSESDESESRSEDEASASPESEAAPSNAEDASPAESASPSSESASSVAAEAASSPSSESSSSVAAEAAASPSPESASSVSDKAESSPSSESPEKSEEESAEA